ncbi:MAG: HNH endonuclease [Synergistaceae bacterium]|nr:HNH endonuclease [Synergistaceae bacterium]
MGRKILRYVIKKLDCALPEQERFNPGLCPICDGQLRIAVLQKIPTGAFVHGIVCDNGCFPVGICTGKTRQANTAKMVARWKTEYVSMMRVFSKAPALSFPCPSCGGTVRLTPDLPQDNRPILRAYCVDNGCELPLQWAIPRKDCRDDLVIKAVQDWKRQLPIFHDWYRTPLDEARFRKLEPQFCHTCRATVPPVLQHSASFIGRAEWICPRCGGILSRAELNQKKIRRGTAALKIENMSGGECAVCGRSQSMVEAGGSRLEKHHKTPLVDAGRDVPSNVMLMCTECHAAWHATHDALHAQLEKNTATLHGTADTNSRAQFLSIPTPRSLVVNMLVRLRNFLDRCIENGERRREKP